jgi:hypothetical protein
MDNGRWRDASRTIWRPFLGLLIPGDDIDAEPMIDGRLRRGVDASWTSDGRGGGRRGSPARVPPARTELTSLIGSVPLREAVARGDGVMRLPSRSGDDQRAGSSDTGLVR